MWICGEQSRWERLGASLAMLLSVIGLSGTALAQAPGDQTTGKKPEDAADTAASSAAPSTTSPRVAVQTGAPQPVSQNLASPLPPSAPSAAPAVVKVGGGLIILYANNYAPEYDQAGNKKKHLVDVWRASVVLDSKIDRYGLHIELRVRDRNLRWSPVNAWTEELYASVDLIKPTNPLGPLVLKAGKSFLQFGRFWDNSFYGSIQLRDGLKLDANWGLSLEGALGATKTFGTRYFAQYFVVDGQVNTANQNRDTPSILNLPTATQPPGTTPAPVGARRRDRFVFKLEPFFKLSETTFVRVGASFDYFTADFPDDISEANRARGSRIRDIDNKEKVYRYGADFAAQLRWFGVWGEWIHQSGMHTNAWPIAPRADNPATPASEARKGSASDDVTYFMAGGNFTYDRYTLQYNYSSGLYKDIVALDAGNVVGDHREWIHNPSVQVKITDQLKLIAEFPIWRRKPIPGLLPIDPEQLTPTTGKEEIVEKQVLVTLHGKF